MSRCGNESGEHDLGSPSVALKAVHIRSHIGQPFSSYWKKFDVLNSMKSNNVDPAQGNGDLEMVREMKRSPPL